MKIIIDTDKKELGAEDVVTMGQLYEFLEKHGLLDYGLMGVKSDGPSVFPVKFAPNPLDPPWRITCTDPTVSHVDQILDAPKVGGFEDEAIKFGYQRIDPNKYKAIQDAIDPRLSGVSGVTKENYDIQ